MAVAVGGAALVWQEWPMISGLLSVKGGGH